MDRGRRPPEPRLPPWVKGGIPSPSVTPSVGAGDQGGWSRRATSPRRSSHRRRRSRRDGDEGDHRSSSRRRRRRSARDTSKDSKAETPVEKVERKQDIQAAETPVLELGRTSGVTSAGAWGARLEMANLLEARCDPSTLIRMVRDGTESDFPLKMDGKLSVIHPISNQLERKSEASDRSRFSLDLGGESDGVSSMGRDAGSPLGSVGISAEKRPEWAAPLTEEVKAPTKTFTSAVIPGLTFAKPAVPKGFRKVKEEEDLGKTEFGDEKEGARESFAKAAKPPHRRQAVLPTVPVATVGGGSRPKNMDEKESKDLARYHDMSLDIFNRMRVMGIEMDLLEIVRKGDGSINEDRFSIHTAPNRASTGLRYARLMVKLLEWGARDERPASEDSVACNKLGVLDYVEFIIQEGCGCHTPHAVLLAWDYYGKAFGFSAHGGHFGRAKRLASKCTSQAVGGRVGAPLFSREFMNALECMILDPFLNLGARVAAGKLRLCIQSSTRFDDVLNTPLRAWEWVRKKGELEIIGIRSKAVRGKNKPRLWIASTMGVTPSGDGWLKTLVDLLVRMHGSDWMQDDHTGKLVSRDGKTVYPSPARMDADVSILKSTMLDNLGISGATDLRASDIEVMRWHGAKATLVTVMQHLNLPPRVVRFAGDWSSKDESMMDLYLREAQLMTLNAQQEALKFLRLGGGVVGLEGQGIAMDPTTQDGEPRSKDDVMEAMAKMEETYMKPADVSEHFFDKVFSDGLPDLKKVEEEREPAEQVMLAARKLLVEDVSSEDDSASDEDDTFEDTEEKKEALEVAAEPEEKLAEKDGARAEDEGAADESLVSSFVQVVRPNKLSKLHVALPNHKLVALGSARPLPKCGARGDYEVSAGENLSAGLCVRCFGAGKCDRLCEYVKADEAGTGHVRCARRCAETGEHTAHFCVFHNDDL